MRPWRIFGSNVVQLEASVEGEVVKTDGFCASAGGLYSTTMQDKYGGSDRYFVKKNHNTLSEDRRSFTTEQRCEVQQRISSKFLRPLYRRINPNILPPLNREAVFDETSYILSRQERDNLVLPNRLMPYDQDFDPKVFDRNVEFVEFTYNNQKSAIRVQDFIDVMVVSHLMNQFDIINPANFPCYNQGYDSAHRFDVYSFAPIDLDIKPDEEIYLEENGSGSYYGGMGGISKGFPPSFVKKRLFASNPEKVLDSLLRVQDALQKFHRENDVSLIDVALSKSRSPLEGAEAERQRCRKTLERNMNEKLPNMIAEYRTKSSLQQSVNQQNDSCLRVSSPIDLQNDKKWHLASATPEDVKNALQKVLLKEAEGKGGKLFMDDRCVADAHKNKTWMDVLGQNVKPVGFDPSFIDNVDGPQIRNIPTIAPKGASKGVLNGKRHNPSRFNERH